MSHGRLAKSLRWSPTISCIPDNLLASFSPPAPLWRSSGFPSFAQLILTRRASEEIPRVARGMDQPPSLAFRVGIPRLIGEKIPGHQPTALCIPPAPFEACSARDAFLSMTR